MNVQFLTDNKGNKTGVVLSMKQYQKLIEDAEDLDAVRAYDHAKKNAGKTRSFDEFVKELNKN
jgi:hypothetical protein